MPYEGYGYDWLQQSVLPVFQRDLLLQTSGSVAGREGTAAQSGLVGTG
jgi:hypothetical protein